jgi:hypothetical protein
MSLSSVVLNTTNLLSLPNTFNVSVNPPPYNRLYLPVNNGINLKGYQISLNKININYSWPNVTSINNIFNISWKVAGTFTDFTATIPANTNYESISALNSWLQSYMIANGLYLINASSQNVYYMEFVQNPTYYGVSLNLYLVPTSLPATYTEPSNFAGYPTASCTMKASFPSTSLFYKLIGFASDTVFNGASSAISYVSSFTPQLSPTSSIYVSCNIVMNPLSLNGSSSIINTFTTKSTAYGATIVVEPNETTWYDVNGGSISNIIVEFFDQNLTALNIRDPDITCILLLRMKPKNE